jgi:hypothetical protein
MSTKVIRRYLAVKYYSSKDDEPKSGTVVGVALTF